MTPITSGEVRENGPGGHSNIGSCGLPDDRYATRAVKILVNILSCEERGPSQSMTLQMLGLKLEQPPKEHVGRGLWWEQNYTVS